MVLPTAPLFSVLSNAVSSGFLAEFPAASVIGVSLPSFITPDRLRWIIPMITLGMFFAAFWVMRFITKLAIKASILGVIAIFLFTLWIQRSDLGDCAKTCECSLYSIDVDITQDQYVEYGCKK